MQHKNAEWLNNCRQKQDDIKNRVAPKLLQ